MSVIIHKAHGYENKPVEDEIIYIESDAPRFDSLQKQADFYKDEGDKLAETLWRALPGGTMDSLIAALLKQRASLFIVSFGTPEKEKK